jgi:NNP family nitrate/nitrite transporter-like MFS transporter
MPPTGRFINGDGLMYKPAQRASLRSASSRIASTRTPFWRAGHSPTLIAAFLYFNFTFMAWVLLGPLAVQIAADLHLSPGQQGLMIATPLAAGAVLRVLMGLLADRLQPRAAGAFGQVVVIVALFCAWVVGVNSYGEVLALGVALGLAGASFAVALRLAAAIYPPEHKGMALGFAGAGNFGTVLSALFGPALADAYGWQNVIGLAILPLAAALLFYLVAARDPEERAPRKPVADYLRVLRSHDALWFMFFYAVSFGGFVGLASFLTVYFSTQFSLPAVPAGYCAALCCGIGSLLRPLGVRVAERAGGIRVLGTLFGAAALLFGIAATGLHAVPTALLIFGAAMLALGMANGALFQVVPQRFRKELDEVTAMMGGAGALGGCLLVAALGYAREAGGSYQAGLLMFTGCALVTLVGLWIVKTRWRGPARSNGAARA